MHFYDCLLGTEYRLSIYNVTFNIMIISEEIIEKIRL